MRWSLRLPGCQSKSIPCPVLSFSWRQWQAAHSQGGLQCVVWKPPTRRPFIERDAMNVVRLQPSPPFLRQAATPTVQAVGVNHAFDTETSPKQVLFDIDFTLASGEFVILTGPSGAGK